MKCRSLLLPLMLAMLAGCSKPEPTATGPTPGTAGVHNCVTTGPNSPIVVGANSVVVIDGKAYASGQSTDCAPSSNNISTYGANSPIITGVGSKVVIKTEQSE